jgi:UMF1 family MFS transporter
MNSSTTDRSVWRREVLAWCCYDWANSGYTTLMITIIVVYIQRTVFSPDSSGVTGSVVWAWSVAISMLLGAFLSPVVGALADAHRGKRLGLALAAGAGSAACMAMAIVPPQQTWLVVGLLIAATLSLELSLTFYNGFLPEIADDTQLNRVSAAGMGWGYLGGGLALLWALLLLKYGHHSGPGDDIRLLRICIFLTGVWWLVFSIPTIVILRDKPLTCHSTGRTNAITAAIRDVGHTLYQLRSQRTLALFLLAFLFYNDGLQTVISQASTFALQELSFADRELVAVVLMVQFVATPGAILIGWVADRAGRKNTLLLCLGIWIVLLGSAWFVRTKPAYWVMAAGVAIVLGGTQAVSRAIMGALTPVGQEARYFGFFNLSGKATSFMGTFFFGLIVVVTGSSRLAIVNLLVFFMIGLVLVWQIDLNRPTKSDTTGAEQNQRMS